MDSRNNNKYLDCFNTALTRYQGQQNDDKSNRLGYGLGWLSWLRHDYNIYPHIQELQDNLGQISDDQAIKVLDTYFRHPLTKFNNHSFAMYFLDELLISLPEEKNTWESYYPPNKQIIFYQGTLYRGMKIGETLLNYFFQYGFDSREHSEWVDAYANDTTMALGISTSKSADVAKMYASARVTRGVARECGKSYFIPGYLLEINYRGQGGIDIIPTLKRRGEDFNVYCGEGKQEVNIIGRIEPSDIKGAWPILENGKQTYIQNKFYTENFSLDDVQTKEIALPHRLNNLFSK